MFRNREFSVMLMIMSTVVLIGGVGACVLNLAAGILFFLCGITLIGIAVVFTRQRYHKQHHIEISVTKHLLTHLIP
jgi:uncharacterized membrane protein